MKNVETIKFLTRSGEAGKDKIYYLKTSEIVEFIFMERIEPLIDDKKKLADWTVCIANNSEMINRRFLTVDCLKDEKEYIKYLHNYKKIKSTLLKHDNFLCFENCSTSYFIERIINLNKVIFVELTDNDKEIICHFSHNTNFCFDSKMYPEQYKKLCELFGISE